MRSALTWDIRCPFCFGYVVNPRAGVRVLLIDQLIRLVRHLHESHPFELRLLELALLSRRLRQQMAVDEPGSRGGGR